MIPTRQAAAIISNKFTFKKTCSQKGGESLGIAMATMAYLQQNRKLNKPAAFTGKEKAECDRLSQTNTLIMSHCDTKIF